MREPTISDAIKTMSGTITEVSSIEMQMKIAEEFGLPTPADEETVLAA